LRALPGFSFVKGDLVDAALLRSTVEEAGADVVAHLAAQAGVRYSIESPQSYIQSNLVGTANLLEALRATPPRHLIFASTSSVYGGNVEMPFAEIDRADGPVSLYAATKKGGEAMVHAYSHLWSIPATCVRFFTVYGPYSRPDMAPIKFARAMLAGQPIDVYGQGKMRRDFTYVDDLVAAIVALMDTPPRQGEPVARDSLSAVAPFRTVNIGGGRPVELMDFIAALEHALGQRAILNMLPMQPGDVVATEADTGLLRALVGELPQTSLEDGVRQFAVWYRAYSGR
jgi:UDP-glucuronate 4-epimerase